MVNLKSRNLLWFLFVVATRQNLPIILSVVIAIFFGAVLAVSSEPRYEAKSSLLLKFGREYIYRPEVGNGNVSRQFSQSEEVINSEVQILNSGTLKREVIQRMGPTVLYPELDKNNLPDTILPSISRIKRSVKDFIGFLINNSDEAKNSSGKKPLVEKALEKFNKGYKVTAAKSSHIIHLYFEHTDRVLAERILTHVIEVFTEQRLKIFSNAKLSFLEERLAEQRDKLQTVEQALQRFKTSNKVYQIDEQTRLLLNEANDLQRSRRSTANRVAELRERSRIVSEQMKDVPREVSLHTDTKTDHIREAERRLLDLRLKEKGLLSEFTEKSEKVINVRKEIAEVEKFVARQKTDTLDIVRRGTNSVHTTLELEILKLNADLSSTLAKKRSHQHQFQTVEAEIRRLEEARSKLADLERIVTIEEANYRALQEKAAEEHTEEQLDKAQRTNIRIVQEPTAPYKALGSSKSVKVFLSAVVGMIFGFGISVIIEIRRGVFYEPDSVNTTLGVPVLAVFPSLVIGQRWWERLLVRGSRQGRQGARS